MEEVVSERGRRHREFPELERLPAARRWLLGEYLARGREAGEAPVLTPGGRFWRVGLLLVVMVGAFVGGRVVLVWFGVPRDSVSLVMISVLVPVNIWLVRVLFGRSNQRLIWRALNKAGARTCFGCGYDCRGTAEGVCPECGGSLEGAASFDDTIASSLVADAAGDRAGGRAGG